jgi:hypothetical protein
MSSAPDRLDKINAIALKGGLEAGTYALLGSTAVSLLAARLLPSYRSLTLQGRVFMVTAVTAGCSMVGAEHAIYHYNRPFLLGSVYDTEGGGRKEKGESGWFRHRFEIAGGAMAGIIAGGLFYFSGNTNRTGAEKFMSIRLFAHACGLAGLLGLVAVASVSSLQKHQD